MINKDKGRWLLALVAMLLLAAVLMGGCSSKSVLEDEGDETPFSVTISASPSSIDMAGTAVVEARMLQGSTPVVGVEMQFQVTPTDAGHFSPTTMVTDENGLAAVSFVPSTIGQAEISVSGTSGLATATNSVSITVAASAGDTPESNGEINSIYLYSDSINLVVKATGGIESSQLHAIGYDINGNPVPEGVAVNFIITDGPGGGEYFDTVGYGPFATTTNSEGVASVTIHSGTISGTIRIRAYTDSSISNAAQILVSAGPPEYIAIGSEFCNINYWGTVAEKVVITAVVSDVYHNPVNDSTVVYFSTDEGTMKSHEERTRDLEGIVSTVWISGYPTVTNPLPDGKVWIYAETAGGTVRDSGMFYNSWYTSMFTVQGLPSTMIADGVFKVVVSIQGWDLNDNPVVDGTTFESDARFLQVESGAFEYACGGVANALVSVQASQLEYDYSTIGSPPGGVDDGIGAIDTVRFWSASSFWSAPVVITTGPAHSDNTKVEANTSVRVGETVTLNVTVADRWDNPLGDHTIVMTPPATGVAGGTTQSTNAYGEAFGFMWTPADTGNILITLTDTDPRGQIVLTEQITVSE